MNEELRKGLVNLIDETLNELDELKKSRFSAQEVKIKGAGEDNLAGKPTNGDLAAKNEVNTPGGKFPDGSIEDMAMSKGEDEEDEDDSEDDVAKADDECHEDDPDHEKKEKKIAKKLLDMHKGEDEDAPLAKSADEVESLMKSYVEDRIAPLEAQLSSILDAVNALGNAPLPAKGASYKNVAPLHKSSDSAFEPLTKTQVAEKLFELKKSGTRVDSADISRAEMGHGLEDLITKYNIQ